MERTKTIKFNMDNENDKLLYEWLSHLPYGEFTERTKKFWFEQCQITDKDMERRL